MSAKVFQGGTSGGNWNNNANWVGGAFAISGDTVTFTGSNPCIINVASACDSIDFTGWSQTITFTSTLSVGGNVTLSSGMTFAGASALIMTTTATLTTNGKIISVPLTLNGAVTYTFADNPTLTSTFTVGTGASTTTLNGASGVITITVQGNLALSTGGSTGIVGTGANTVSLLINGTASQTWSGGDAINLPLTISKTGNTLVVSNGVVFGGSNTPLFTYSSGTVTTTSSTLKLLSCTINSAGIGWNNVIISTATTTITITSLMSVGTLTISNTPIVFQGTAGFTTGTLSIANAGITVTFIINVTYTVTTILSLVATSASHIIFKSSSGGTQTIFVLNNNATQDVNFVNATDINSTLGQQINTFKGTLSNATNWNSLINTNNTTIGTAFTF